MISEQAVTEYMKIYERESGKKLTRQEAYEQATNLVNFVKLLCDCKWEEQQRKAKLTEFPKGYHLTNGKTYNCSICRTEIKDETTWYDKNGNKCLTCQKALNRKIIPGSVCHDKDSWYAMYEFDYYFKIKAATVRRLVRENKLKARIIKGESGKPYFYVFLIKDNPGILPPKPESYMVDDGNGYMHVEYKKADIDQLMELINIPGKIKNETRNQRP